MKPKIFLTGSTGFLGKYLKNTLIKNGYSLVCLCRNNLEDSKDKSTIISATDEDFFSKDFLKNAINLFARILSSRTSYLLRRGLDRGYIEKNEIYSICEY